VNASQQEDFLLRQVAAVGAALARILGLRRGGAADEARAELNHAYGLLLGTPSDLLRTVDVASVAALVDAPDALLALARLAAEEAEQEGEAERRAALRLRAAALAIEALRHDDAHRAARDFLAGIVPLVDSRAFTRDQRGVLAAAEGGHLRRVG
jgi:hypothetical protein